MDAHEHPSGFFTHIIITFQNVQIKVKTQKATSKSVINVDTFQVLVDSLCFGTVF